jgi:proteasome lid subunit RPN8/RPN11
MGRKMTLQFSETILAQIRANGEEAYPEEGAGFLLGKDGITRTVRAIFALSNIREEAARPTRYLIEPADYIRAEIEAERLDLSLIGVFHSHPDHPNQPSEYDRDWAQPFFSYVITSVETGKAKESKSWRLLEDRTRFEEEQINITI